MKQSRDGKVLGAYVLPGPAMDPTVCVAQTTGGEAAGLGSVWLSELQGPLKDAGALCALMGHVTTDITVGTSISHFGTRHPVVQASWGATMQVITGNRFAMGFGRSVPQRWLQWGIPVPTLASMRDYADILRRLWAHETVTYDGPAGRYPTLSLGDFPDVAPPPILLAAVGAKTLELAGEAFDGVFLHPFLTPDAVAESCRIVRTAAERAGRDPQTVEIYHELVIAPDAPDAVVDLIVRARLAAYMGHAGGYADLIASMNGWDAGPIDALREAVRAVESDPPPGLGQRERLIPASRMLPDKWFETTAGLGTTDDCARAIHGFLDAGADKVILHGTTPEHLGATVRAFSMN